MAMQTAPGDRRHDSLKVWVAMKRFDLNDSRIISLKEIHIPCGSESAAVKEILCHSFRLNSSTAVFKMRNINGSLIPINSDLTENNKHKPYILEVVNTFQHVVPRSRTVAVTVINKSMKNRLQNITRRIERLEELVPEIKLRHQEKINQEMEFLRQKLVFLNQRMQMADSHSWTGMFRRPPLW
ncbi:uncharacterized protein si:zfos-1056e6.1 [Polypterus senegalus]|uniref:uncharacterized protein si:zfos-1056e6.1 n=1 Tax=Polypterus senegalus TaxID=55291 RepID=UPI0019623F04|nr:uncharacterized protein si:zfos-1056e6.1 [Polypterus senegalus]